MQQLIEAAKHAEQTHPVFTRLEFDAHGVRVRQHLYQYAWTSIILWNEIERLIMMIDSGACMLIAKRLRDHTEWPIMPMDHAMPYVREMTFKHRQGTLFLIHPGTWRRINAHRSMGYPWFDPYKCQTIAGISVHETMDVPEDVLLLTDASGFDIIDGVRIEP